MTMQIIDDTSSYFSNEEQQSDENYSNEEQVQKPTSLSVKNLTLKVDKGLTIIKNVSFNIKESEMVFIIGPTGSGKSTLLNLLGRHILPSNTDSSSILVHGRPLSSGNLRQICYLKQDASIVFKGVLRDELEFYALMSPTPGLSAYERVNQLALDLEIEHMLDRKMDIDEARFSSGELKRIQLCSALLQGGSILLLDEVTSGLDPDNIQSVMKILVSVRDKYKMTIIATLHQVQFDDIKNWDRFMIMSSGSIIAGGVVGKDEDTTKNLLKSVVNHDLLCEPGMDKIKFLIYEELVVLASHITLAQSIFLGEKYSNSYVINHEDVFFIEPALRESLPIYKQICALLKRGLLSELIRVYHVVDLLQLCFEMGVQLLFFKGLLSNSDGLSGSFYTHIGPLYSMNISCAYRGAFTAFYGEYRNYPTIRNHILTKLYSRSAYIIYHLLTTFIVGIIWPIIYFTLAMWIQGAPWNSGAIVSGLVGLLFTYLSGQLVGIFSAMVATTFIKGISLMVVLNWLQLMPSGSFHNVDTMPENMRWLTDISYLYYTTATTIVGVTGLAVEYTCNGVKCTDEEVYWGPSTLGYNLSYTEYALFSLLWYLSGITLVVVTFYASKRYRPKKFEGLWATVHNLFCY